MGCSSITVEPGYHLFTATFEDCAGNEYKINDIKVLNEDGSAWDVKDTSSTACAIQKMTTDGSGKYDTDEVYNYRHYFSPVPPPAGTDRGLGWYVGAGFNSRAGDNITIKNGEGISINNKTGKNIKLQFAGAVTLTGRSFKVGTGYSLVGNLTPVDVKLNDVVILKEDGTPWDVKDTSSTACAIQKMTTDGSGKYDTDRVYNYRHYFSPVPPPAGTDRGLGWYVGAGFNSRVTDEIKIESGEALSINNKSGADIIVVFPSPIKEEAK